MGSKCPLTRAIAGRQSEYEEKHRMKTIVTASSLVRAIVEIPGAVLALLLCAIAASAAENTNALPFHESFSGTRLSSGWTTTASRRSAVNVRDGVLEIESSSGSFARIQRPLGVNCVRASCALKAQAAGSDQTAALFLFWGPKDWVQIGATADGRYVVGEARKGNWFEWVSAKAAAGPWHYAAIELSADGIRYLSSQDGSQWQTEHITFRSATLEKSPPALVMIGRGYGITTDPWRDFQTPWFPPDLNKESPVAGQRIVCSFKDFSVMPTPSDRVHLSAAEVRRLETDIGDIPGNKELARRDDPSFDSVAAYYPGMKSPREIVGVKDHPCSFGVDKHAALELTASTAGQPLGFFTVGSPAVQFGTGPAPCRKRLLDGYLPIVVASWNHAGLEYEQTVFGHSEGMSVDNELFAYVRLLVNNPASAAKRADIQFCIKPASDQQQTLHWTLEVPPNNSKSIWLKIPHWTRAKNVVEVAAEDYEARRQDTVSYWMSLLNSGTTIETPERRINDAYRAWLAYSFLNVHKLGGVYCPRDGTGFYENIYGYSAAIYCNTLDVMGRHDLARQYITSLLTFVHDDGLLNLNFGHVDGGLLLIAMVQHYRMTNDRAWLDSMTPKMIKMCDWIINARQKFMEPIGGKRSPAHGMIRLSAYCDYPEADPSFFPDAYLCVSLEQVAQLFADVGLGQQSTRIRAEAAAYRKDLLADMDQATFEHEGLKLLPTFPLSHHNTDLTYTADSYWGVDLAMLLESGFLPPADPRSRMMVEILQRRGGLYLGQCRFYGGIDHAYTYGYWMNCLERDQVKPVILGLYGAMAYGMSRETFSGTEVSYEQIGENDIKLPHLYSCSQQLRLLRMMLLREEGDTLWIGQAIPRDWLKPGRQVVVAKAPTTFGDVGFRISAAADEMQVRINVAADSHGAAALLTAPTQHAPSVIQLRLRDPRHRNIAAVTVNKLPYHEFSGETITLRGLDGPADIRVRFADSER
jgi:hypothetical protein